MDPYGLDRDHPDDPDLEEDCRRPVRPQPGAEWLDYLTAPPHTVPDQSSVKFEHELVEHSMPGCSLSSLSKLEVLTNVSLYSWPCTTIQLTHLANHFGNHWYFCVFP